ncbi:hypothetical protein [Angustibacter sp. Root456]|uniref:hypothetical protein n=1 Tax=Angustibacter sp. Root456 TaxID=1736539 RepID=UPI0006FDFF7E|nr:hypothetical protein [Angustibacter sp. Root456]KQX61744.1 hypothetical protein ASD06_14255 [Angustibacter sp. Root456]
MLSKPWWYFSSNSEMVVVERRSSTRSTTLLTERATTSLLNSDACFVDSSLELLVAKSALALTSTNVPYLASTWTPALNSVSFFSVSLVSRLREKRSVDWLSRSSSFVRSVSVSTVVSVRSSRRVSRSSTSDFSTFSTCATSPPS